MNRRTTPRRETGYFEEGNGIPREGELAGSQLGFGPISPLRRNPEGLLGAAAPRPPLKGGAAAAANPLPVVRGRVYAA